MNIYEEDLDMGVDESAMCDSCLDAAEDEGWMGIGGDMDDLLLGMCEDMADHLCDMVETNGEIQCKCACKPFKHKLRYKE